MKVETVDADFYHSGKGPRRPKDRMRNVLPQDRPFIFWDGEGAKDTEKRQSYVLLGNSTGDSIISKELHTKDMLEFIIQCGINHPTAYHVGFAFDYDVNMIIRNMGMGQFKSLRDNGSCLYKNFRIEHIPSKWFQVTKYGPNWPEDKKDYRTVKICDTFGFFQCSFLKAIKSYIPKHPVMAQIDLIERGKAARNQFTYAKIDFIKEYWTTEAQLGQALIEQLRDYLYDVDLTIKQWHGPGALANFAYKRNGIRNAKQETNSAVYDAARYAYAGGRFERFQIGRFRNGYSLDINSAYPAAIAELPDLTEGTWNYVEKPQEIQEFGVYHVRLIGSPVTRTPSPLFHRDHAGNISYPWITEGWYWSPEVALLRNLPGAEILEGWEYLGWESRPFQFVKDVYAQRRIMKSAGHGSEKALKLLLNSLYGKMAQRVGWERSGKAPLWHQLEWAGYVTSATRAKLFSVMARIPRGALIAVETDGIYTTMNPAELGIQHSTSLGDWEVKPFDEIRYVQSGMYTVGREGKWVTKYRGLDANTINALTLRRHLRLLEPNVDQWPMLSGPTTRFVGYRLALWREEMGMGPFRVHHARWETDTKDLSAGSAGKRVHSPKLCTACDQNKTAWEMPHDTIIRSRSIQDMMSRKHDIPWLDDDRAAWRDHAEGLVA